MASTPLRPRRLRRRGRRPFNLELFLGRLVAVALLAVPAAALIFIVRSANTADRGAAASQIAAFNPRALLGQPDDTHFLPSPVAAIPPQANTGPAPAAAQDPAPADVERVKIANTGGIGVVLRQDPQGKPVGSLKDGQVLQVLEHRSLGDAEWLRVRTETGTEGWVFGRLVGPA